MSALRKNGKDEKRKRVKYTKIDVTKTRMMLGLSDATAELTVGVGMREE